MRWTIHAGLLRRGDCGNTGEQLLKFAAHGALEGIGGGADELAAVKGGTQPHHVGRRRQARLEAPRSRW